MSSFEDVLLRLKQRLGISTDKGVAAALGMSPTAFNDRKARESFPEDKLRAAAHAHPEWLLDVDYVLTGASQREDRFAVSTNALKKATEKVMALALPQRELMLVRDVVFGVEMGQPALVMTSIEQYTIERRERDEPKKGGDRTKQVFKAKVGQVAGRDIVNRKEKEKKR